MNENTDKTRRQFISAINSLGQAIELMCDTLDDMEKRLQKLERRANLK